MLERPIALKILKKELSDDLSFQNRFRQEARASARLIHPNIVTTFDFGYDRDRLFIVMEYVQGTELKVLMSEGKKIPLKVAIDYIQQTCRGLAYAHQQGFVHCDIKPQNLMVSDEKVLKITDFGISRALDSVTREEQTDVVWGSPYYISPEQAAGKAPSPATDIYALGVVAYELFSKKLPFEAENSAELARMHRMEIPRPLIEVDPHVPHELNRIVMRCLEKDPVDRFETAGKLEEALSRIRIPIPSAEVKPVQRSVYNQSEPKPDEPEPGKPDMATILLSLLALILAGGLIPFWLYVVLSINSINR